MKEKRPQERRRYVRVDVAAKVIFRVKPENKGGAPPEGISAVSKNLSVEGICFTSEQHLAPGTDLELQIVLSSDPEPLILNGEVKWSRPAQKAGSPKAMFDIGIELHTLGLSDENRYLRYVSEKMMERLSQYLHL